MLFVALMRRKEGTPGRRVTRARRIDWHYPEGLKVLGEYWLSTDDPSVIWIAETEDIGAIRSAIADWDDFYEIRVFPAIPAEVGIAAAREAMAVASV